MCVFNCGISNQLGANKIQFSLCGGEGNGWFWAWSNILLTLQRLLVFAESSTTGA